ncbi:MAG: arginine--tRNA ligase [Acidimicrobiales bacterium]
MTIRAGLAESVRATLSTLGVDTQDLDVQIERPARPEHGAWSTNVALVLAKRIGRNPRQLAEDLVRTLEADPPPHVAAVTVAGPGFVNFELHDSWLHDVLRQVVDQGTEGYARHDLGHGENVNVEFVSANPTGPLHVGGGRWAAYGDSLCRVLARCGYVPHREYYVNDRGNQMDLFLASMTARREGQPLPEGGYPGEYVGEWAAEMPVDVDAAEWGYERVMAELRQSLDAIDVHFDTWFSERSMVATGVIDAALAELADRGVVYEADGATWLRTTDLGLAKDEVLVKSGGEPTYFLSDIAYHRDKLDRGFSRLIDVWGADHHGHVARLKAAMVALGHPPEALEIILGQLVTVSRGGEEVRMGKRSGDFVELAEVVDEVGPDVARLTFLLQSVDTRQTFDIDAVVARSMDNPVYYVQYAHARIASIGRVAAERGLSRLPIGEVDLALLIHPRELEVLRRLEQLPDAVLDACLGRAPHRVATWVQALAGAFHGFYHDCYVMGEGVGPELTQARLWLVEAVRVGLAIGLDLLGVRAPDSM